MCGVFCCFDDVLEIFLFFVKQKRKILEIQKSQIFNVASHCGPCLFSILCYLLLCDLCVVLSFWSTLSTLACKWCLLLTLKTSRETSLLGTFIDLKYLLSNLSVALSTHCHKRYSLSVVLLFQYPREHSLHLVSTSLLFETFLAHRYVCIYQYCCYGQQRAGSTPGPEQWLKKKGSFWWYEQGDAHSDIFWRPRGQLKVQTRVIFLRDATSSLITVMLMLRIRSVVSSCWHDITSQLCLKTQMHLPDNIPSFPSALSSNNEISTVKTRESQTKQQGLNRESCKSQIINW